MCLAAVAGWLTMYGDQGMPPTLETTLPLTSTTRGATDPGPLCCLGQNTCISINRMGFKEGELVLCYSGELPYQVRGLLANACCSLLEIRYMCVQAKILKTQHSQAKVKYLVHYTGWKARYDGACHQEMVIASRVNRCFLDRVGRRNSNSCSHGEECPRSS